MLPGGVNVGAYVGFPPSPHRKQICSVHQPCSGGSKPALLSPEGSNYPLLLFRAALFPDYQDENNALSTETLQPGGSFPESEGPSNAQPALLCVPCRWFEVEPEINSPQVRLLCQQTPPPSVTVLGHVTDTASEKRSEPRPMSCGILMTQVNSTSQFIKLPWSMCILNLKPLYKQQGRFGELETRQGLCSAPELGWWEGAQPWGLSCWA